jgi:hypothetical protein
VNDTTARSSSQLSFSQQDLQNAVRPLDSKQQKLDQTFVANLRYPVNCIHSYGKATATVTVWGMKNHQMSFSDIKVNCIVSN